MATGAICQRVPLPDPTVPPPDRVSVRGGAPGSAPSAHVTDVALAAGAGGAAPPGRRHGPPDVSGCQRT